MKIILCIDDNNGLKFNGKRLSRDRMIYEDIMSYVNTLQIDKEAKILFEEDVVNIYKTINVTSDDYYFVEDNGFINYLSQINEIVLYYWNRRYPADTYFDKNILLEFKLKESKEFKGFSHEKITKEVYIRR